MAIPPRRHPIRTFLETYPHVWYLLIWIVYLMLFWLAEHLIVDKYWVSHLPIDDQIPFCRFFIIPYCTWHPLLFLMTVYLFFTDAPAFKRFVVYIGLGFGGSILFCMLFPNGQDLRPTEFAQNDFFIWLVRMVYAADTNTNVLPSMHVIGCAACYQDCFSLHIAQDCIEIHPDGISWQQILNFYFLSDLFFFLHSSHSHSVAFFSRIQLSCSCRQSSSKYSISSAERKPAFCFPQIRNPCRLQCCRN